MEAIVKMSGISKNYHSKEGEISAISHVDLTVAEGEFVSIVGPSGCGKSTLLSIIAGLIEPSGGLVSANGEIGYMFQRDHLFPWRTILSNALLGLEIQKK